MFMTLPGFIIIFAIHALIGMMIAFLVTFALLRRRTTMKTIMWASVASTICWLYTIHLSDLAGVSGYPANGKWETLSWRQNTPWQNLLGDHPYIFGFIAASIATAAVATIRSNFASKRNANSASF